MLPRRWREWRKKGTPGTLHHARVNKEETAGLMPSRPHRGEEAAAVGLTSHSADKWGETEDCMPSRWRHRIEREPPWVDMVGPPEDCDGLGERAEVGYSRNEKRRRGSAPVADCLLYTSPSPRD